MALILTVRVYNEAGIHLYERTGFERVGLLKEVAFIDNQFCDEYFYQII
jgi:RimJ/RimL family protein N-acetyltransferase